MNGESVTRDMSRRRLTILQWEPIIPSVSATLLLFGSLRPHGLFSPSNFALKAVIGELRGDEVRGVSTREERHQGWVARNAKRTEGPLEGR